MKILLLETSSEKSFLALIQENEILELFHLPSGPALSKCLALEVANLLSKHDFQPEKIVVGKGPGSPTGIRVGTALAQALAFGWNIPIAYFWSLKTLIPPQDGSFALLSDARSLGINIMKGERQGFNIFCEEPRLISPNDLETEIQEIRYIASFHPHILQKRFRNLPCIEETLFLDCTQLFSS